MSQGRVEWVACPECGQPTDKIGPAMCARMIGKSFARVKQLLKAGRFPNATKVNDRWQIPLADIYAYLEAKR